MIDRLLEKLETPRRHLATLVGLLLLVFILTGVVAWRAHQAELEREEIAEKVLEETAARAAREWARFYVQGLYSSLVTSLSPVMMALLAEPEMPAVRLDGLAIDSLVCISCEGPVVLDPVITVDLPAGTIGGTDREQAERIGRLLLARSETFGQASRVHERFRMAAYFVSDSAEWSMVVGLAMLDEAERPARIVAIPVHESTARQMLGFSFETAELLPTALLDTGTADSLFAARATVGPHTASARGSAGGTMHTEVLDSSAVFGLALHVAPGVGAGELLLLGGTDQASRSLLILILMITIGGLLIVAVLQIRRETVLMRLRADFISSVSHELRTPLAQIRMFTEMLQLGRARSDVERRRALEIIDQETRRLSHLVENVLLFARTEGGRRPKLTPEPTDLAEHVRHAVDIFALMCRARNVDVRLELQENTMVEVDRNALRQILLNLIDNALKYGPAGQRITVGVALYDDVARIWVDDEGPGIPVDQRSAVFDSFYRLPRDTATRVSGSGIGLAVVRELARLHDGEAWAEGAPGGGARIVVQIPDAYLRTGPAGGFAAAS